MTELRSISTKAASGVNCSVMVSVVMPCLNEADTVARCVRTARIALAEGGIEGEIIVADNGSIDCSQELAREAGARVVEVRERGYGSALMGGIEAAHGEFVVMGDADDSYDFSEIGQIVIRLREGFDLVQGCRFPSGGGQVLPGAMPFLHRWWGNPMFTFLAKWWFGSPVNDIYCGLRGFRRVWWKTLGQRCTGMEFATEMLIKASLTGARIGEVPITLRPDGRKAHAPHLKTFRDGWRTLRFFLFCTPRWLFLIPGVCLVGIGIVGYALALPGVSLGGARLDAHTLLCASLAILCGWQAMIFSVCTKTFATKSGLLPADAKLQQWLNVATLERSLLASMVVLVFGLLLIGLAANQWRTAHFGPLDYSKTMRLVVPGATLTALGFQSILASFLINLMATERR